MPHDAVPHDAGSHDAGRFDAVVLAGGAARRLGGRDKPAVPVAGVSLLERVLTACRGAGRVIVVGPPRELPGQVRQVRESPPGGGPLAALRAGLPVVDAPLVAVLAADLPFLTAVSVEGLLQAAAGHDGAMLVDGDGRDQVLCGVWSTAALRAGVARTGSARLRDAVAGLDVVRMQSSQSPAPWLDCDTPADLEAAERVAVGAGR